MVGYLNLFRVIHLAITFILLFAAFNTLGGLTQSICSDLKLPENFGLIMQATIYLSLSIFNFFTGGIISKFGTKRVMPVCSLFYLIWIGALALPAYCSLNPHNSNLDNNICKTQLFSEIVLIVMSIIVGCAAGPMWVSQAAYIEECSIDVKTETYQGIFYGIFMSQSLIGNLSSYLIFRFNHGKNFSDFTYIISCTCVALLGVISYFLLTQPRNQTGEIVVKIQKSVPFCQVVCNKIRALLVTIKELKMILLLPSLIYSAVRII